MGAPPKWSSGAFGTREVPVPDVPTAFETLIESVGLQTKPELWPYNAKVRAFAQRNRKTRYVPEELLELLGLDPEPEFD